MSKKYCLTDNTIEHNGYILYQIKALRDMSNISVQAGDLGGYIASEENLSQEGDCWIHWHNNNKSSLIYENARILDNAQIYFGVEISGSAEISGDVFIHSSRSSFGVYITDTVKIKDKVEILAKEYGGIRILDNVIISEQASLIAQDTDRLDMRISDNARIYGSASIRGYNFIYGNAEIFGESSITDSRICGNAKVYGKAVLSNKVFLSGNVEVFDNARMFDGVASGNAKICGDAIIKDAWIDGNSLISGNVAIPCGAIISSDAELKKESDIFLIGTGKSVCEFITFYRLRDNQIGVSYRQRFSKRRLFMHYLLDEFLDFCHQNYSEKISRDFELLSRVVKNQILND